MPHREDGPTPPNRPGNLTVNGVCLPGKALVAVLGDPDGVGDPKAVGFDWQVSDDGQTWTSVGGTSPVYTISAADAGRQLQVRASYVDLAGNVEEVASAPVLVAQPNIEVYIELMALEAPIGASVKIGRAHV